MPLFGDWKCGGSGLQLFLGSYCVALGVGKHHPHTSDRQRTICTTRSSVGAEAAYQRTVSGCH